MADLIKLYDENGERVGTYCIETGRAQIGRLFYTPERTCQNINPVSCRNFICSKCADSYEKGAGDPNPNFCPNCGAKVLDN